MNHTIADSALLTCLFDFQKLFNEHTRVKKLIKKWERAICIESTDTAEAYSMIVFNQQITHIDPGLVTSGDLLETRILLQAEADVLIRIFSGDYNPASAHIDGALAVYSHDKDKVKLEAIAMVIWGLS